MFPLAITSAGKAGPDRCRQSDGISYAPGLDRRQCATLGQQLYGRQILRLRNEASLESVVVRDRN